MPSLQLRDLVNDQVNLALPRAIAFRHHLHKFPELTWQEHQTSAAISDHLSEIAGLKVQTGVARLGVVAELEGEHPGPTIALRADMDALPIEEDSQLAYKSVHSGVMHACGHDGHVANLFGSALVLSELRGYLHGRVKFIFQPAEEGGAGAKAMCEAGVLSDPDVDVVFGMHAWPEAPAGAIWLKDGPLMASNTELEFFIEGRGCHAAMPHLGTDQVLVLARLIESLQSISSRFVSPVDPVVLSICQLEAGHASNVIPAKVCAKGTLRTVSSQTRERCIKEIEQICDGLALAYNVRVHLKATPMYPEVLNHEKPTNYVESMAKELFGETQVRRLSAPTMGAEDFSFYLQKVPGCFFFLGMSNDLNKPVPSLHHPSFNFNDQTLVQGMRLFSHLALGFVNH